MLHKCLWLQHGQQRIARKVPILSCKISSTKRLQIVPTRTAKKLLSPTYSCLSSLNYLKFICYAKPTIFRLSRRDKFLCFTDGTLKLVYTWQNALQIVINSSHEVLLLLPLFNKTFVLPYMFPKEVNNHL